MRPKVGHIEFLNCLPLYYGLVKSSALLDVDLVKGNPTELNSLLINGHLDISPVSSIEYARHHEQLLLFPEFTVSSDGNVKSIILISRYPIEKLPGRKVALTSTSSTSHVLLKFIMNRYEVEPDYIICQPDLQEMLLRADAALLIGDIALKYYVDGEGLYIYDLGLEWKKLTGRKMVYAVWAVNRKFAGMKSELCSHVFEIFRKSMDHSMKHLPEIAEYAARWEPFKKRFLIEYFRSLRFDFGEDYKEGLIHFYRMAKEIGELNDVPVLEFININHISKNITRVK